MRVFLVLLLLAKAVLASGQDISGRWQGNYFAMQKMAQPTRVVVELTVYQDSLLTGTSHLYYANGNYEHYALSGQFFERDSSILFSEDSTISVGNKTIPYCRGKYIMGLSFREGIMRLDGRWKAHYDGLGSPPCPTMGAWFEKRIPPEPSVVSSVPAPKDKILNRKEEVQKLLELNQDERDSIRIELVDNSQIDHDVVSVYLNDHPVLKKHKLTAAPAVFWISLSKASDIASIRMAAESMGSIPPCTALMTVITRKNRYSVTLSSDFGNTGMLKLFLKD
jgi:hypothetical protein